MNTNKINNKISRVSNTNKKEKYEKYSAKAKVDNYIANGIALYMVGRLDEAIMNYRKAVDLDIHNQTAHHKLGLALHKKGMLDDAIREYKLALDISHADVDLHCNLGLALYEKGKLDEALDEYDIALELDNDNAAAYNNIGLIYYAKGMLDDAIENYTTALDISPEYDLAQKNLEKALTKQRELLKEKKILKPGLINFSAVGGLKEVKDEFKMAAIYPLKHHELFKFYKKKICRGILLYGPPGCGKTYIAKAVAGECDAEFFDIKITDIYNKYYGESEKNIHDIFEVARECSPAIIFIDEIDAIGARRDSRLEQFEKRIVNQLLIEISDLEHENSNITVIVATNTPWNIDPALRRPGRFDKLIFVPPPDLEAREKIFEIYMKDRPVEKINYEKLGKITKDYSAADIVQICEEATDIALREALLGKKSKTRSKPRKINMGDFLTAIEKRKSSLITWFNFAQQEIMESGEDDTFKELFELIKRHTEKKVAGNYYR